VGAHSLAAAKRMGGKPDKTLPDGWDRIDPRTGAPAGIGRGWDYAPGASVSREVNAIAGKMSMWDRMIGKAFMDSLPTDCADALADAYRSLPSTADDVRRYAQRAAEGSAEGDENRRPLPPLRTLGRVRSDQVRRINQLIGADVEGYDFSIDAEGAAAAVRGGVRGGAVISPADFAQLPMILSAPDRIEPAGTSAAGEPLLRFIRRIGRKTFIADMAVRGGTRQTLALQAFVIQGSA